MDKSELKLQEDVLGRPAAENTPADARYTGLIPGLGRSHMPRSN